VGINYIPNELLLDPRFAPPEKYIMSRLTPRAPGPALAAALAPVLWSLERPDKFDVYSLGLTLLQAAFSALRSDNAIVALRKKLAALDHDVDAWALTARKSRDYADGFEALDLDGGAAWECVRSLLAADPAARPSARRALRCRWLAPSASASPFAAASPVAAALERGASAAATAVAVELGGAADRGGGLTEAWLTDELGDDGPLGAEPPRASATIAWWRGRQGAAKAAPRGRAAAPAAAPPKGAAKGLLPPGLPRLPWGRGGD